MSDILGYGALAVALAGWGIYVPVSRVPALRRTMWPVWVFVLASDALAVGAIAFGLFSNTADFGLIAAMAALGLSALFVLLFFVMLLVPKSQGRPQVNQTLPDFSVMCLDGKQRAIREIIPNGPALIVFFRGFW